MNRGKSERGKWLLVGLFCVVLCFLCAEKTVRADADKFYYEDGSGFGSYMDSSADYVKFCHYGFDDGTGYLYVKRNERYVVRLSFGNEYLTMWEGEECGNFLSDIKYAYGDSYSAWSSGFYFVSYPSDWSISRDKTTTYLDYTPREDSGDRYTVDMRIFLQDGSGGESSIDRKLDISRPYKTQSIDEWCRGKVGSSIKSVYQFRGARGKWTKHKYKDSDGKSFYKHQYIVYIYYAENCEIMFHANGGEGNMSVVKASGSTILPKNVFSRTGYQFAGWSTSPGGEIEYADEAEISPANDITLYAVWSIHSYPVTYVDVVKNTSGVELGRVIEQRQYNSTVKGTDRGDDKRLGVYYQGYYYSDSTSAVVGTSGAIVYRIFVPTSCTVLYQDVVKSVDGTVLGSSAGQREYGTSVSGAEKGTSAVDGAYYEGYRYLNSTSSSVGLSGTVVYRIFEPISYSVIYQDTVKSESGAVLASSSEIREFGTVVSGEEKGTSTADGAYYEGYRYWKSTSATVGTSKTVVCRVFVPISYSVMYKDVVKSEDGVLLGSSIEQREYGCFVDGAEKGSEKGMGAYYTGYRYAGSTSATVQTSGAVVCRIFVPASCTVTYRDVVGDEKGIVLGSSTGLADYGTTVSGAEKGTSAVDGTYYAGYRYADSTSAVVSLSGTVVCRIFVPIAYPVTYKDVAKGVDGKVLGSITAERDFASIASGEEQGTEKEIGIYYEGYQYSFSTSSSVGVGGVTVYRIFIPAVYDVTVCDVVRVPDGKMLGHKTLEKEYDALADASELGTDPETGAYYQGYKYRSSTSAVVTISGALVYRIFEPESYPIHLFPNEGTIINGLVSSYLYEEGVTLPTSIERLGYTFLGWYSTEDFSEDAITEVKVTDIGEKSFYAKWEKTPYQVSLMGGLDGADIQIIREGEAESISDSTGYFNDTIRINPGARPGYEYDSFLTSLAVKDAVKGEEYIEFTMPASDVVVELVWKECAGIVTSLNSIFYETYRDSGNWYDAKNNAYNVDDDDIILTQDMLTTVYLIVNTKTNTVTEVLADSENVFFIKNDSVSENAIVSEAGVNLFTVQTSRYGKDFTADFTLVGTSKILNQIMDRTESDTYRQLDAYITEIEDQASALQKEIQDRIAEANAVLKETENTTEIWEDEIQHTQELSQAFANAVSKSAVLDDAVSQLLEKTLQAELTEEEKISVHGRLERLRVLVIQLKQDSDRYHDLIETLRELGFDTSDENGLAEQVKNEIIHLRDQTVSQDNAIVKLNGIIQEMEERFRREKEALVKQYEGQMSDQDKRHQEKLQKLQEEWEHELRELSKVYEQERTYLEQKLAECKKQKEEELGNLNSEWEEKLRIQQEQYECQIAFLEQQLQQEKERAEQEIAELTAKWEQEKKDMQEEYEQEKQKVQESYEQRIKGYETQMSDLKNKYERDLTEVESRYEKEIVELGKLHQEEQKKLQDSYEKQLSDLEERHQKELQDLLKQLEHMEENREAAQEEIWQMKEQIQSMEQNYQSELQKKLEDLRAEQESAEEREKRFKQQIQELEKRYEAEKQKNQDYLEQIDEWNRQLSEKSMLIQTQTSTIAVLQEKLADCQRQLEEIRRSEAEKKQQLENLQKRSEQQVNEEQMNQQAHKKYQEELQQNIKQLESEKESLMQKMNELEQDKEQHKIRIEQMEKELKEREIERQQLLDVIQEWEIRFENWNKEKEMYLLKEQEAEQTIQELNEMITLLEKQKEILENIPDQAEQKEEEEWSIQKSGVFGYQMMSGMAFWEGILLIILAFGYFKKKKEQE